MHGLIRLIHEPTQYINVYSSIFILKLLVYLDGFKVFVTYTLMA
jgi:hypothetical protein